MGYCGRFAPSPSGALHFGSLIAALASFLDARKRHGRWLLRIEDIDTPRVVRGAADAILRSLERFGLLWDGPVALQSRRQSHYRDALAILQAQGAVYPCICSRREIAQFAALGPNGRIYPGRCRDALKRVERPAALRVRTEALSLGFRDRIQGEYRQSLAGEIGDFVIRRADGVFAYHLAVVVDDAEQGVTDVVRGSDLLASTPQQIYLQQRLNLLTPRYAHLPVAVDAGGAKLSKQTYAAALDDRRPGDALLAALRFLGQTPPAQLATAEPATLLAWAVENWQPRRIPRRPAIKVEDSGACDQSR